MRSKITKCRRCGLPIKFDETYESRDMVVWSDHEDPHDCIAALRFEVDRSRLQEVVESVQWAHTRISDLEQACRGDRA